MMRRANVHGGLGIRIAAAGREAERADRLLRLNPKQDDFIFGDARFSFYVGGVGAGKTYAGAVRAIMRCQEQPASVGLIGAPTYPMLRDVTQRTFFELCPARLIRTHSKTEQHTFLRNGSEILWRSADNPDRLRGLNLAWFWLDEAPLCGYYVWQLLKARLRQAGQDGPMQTAGWATGTPHGRDGYAQDFELAPRPGHALYRASTRENARNLPPDFIADLGYSGQFADQEIEGLFVAFDGLVYLFDASTDGHIGAAQKVGAFTRVIGGIDWGYTNPAAAVVVGLDGDRRAWVTDEFYQRRAGLEETIIPNIVRLTKAHGVSVWYADSEDPEAISRANQQLAKEGLAARVRPVVKGAGSVRAGIQTVTGMLSRRGDGTRGLYVDPRCVNLIAEFGTYAYQTTDRANRDPSEVPIKQSDHALDALRYALHSEFAGVAKTEAYLSELQRWMGASESDRERRAAEEAEVVI